MVNPVRVYKFYSARWGLDALYRKRLKVSTSSDINDPFEFLAVGESKESRKDANKIRDKMFKTGGIISFSKVWSEPLLWSHYADNHRGLALGFDLKDLDSYPVKYTKTRVQLPPNRKVSNSLDEPFDFQEKIGTTKYKRWEYEGEVRVFPAHSSSVVENGMYFRPFSFIGTLKQVILGTDYQSLENSKLAEELRKQGVELVTTRLAFKTFSVVQQTAKNCQKDL